MTERRPSIGIEIELPWKVMLARVDPRAAEILERNRSYWSTAGREREIVQTALDELDAEYKPKITAAHMAGIGKGNDGYAEFALRPHTEAKPLLDQVAYLYASDLLRLDEKYPLHVTLGGFALNKAAGQLLFGLEIVGRTRPERVLQSNSWNRKGRAGVLDRRPDELALGYTEGVEFRTLELYSLLQLSEIIRTALSGSEAIMQAGEWDSWQAVLRRRAAQKSIDIDTPWPKINEDPAHWLTYAAALHDHEWVHDSAHEIIELVD